MNLKLSNQDFILKTEFYRFCLSYFNEFGWKIDNELSPQSFTISRMNLNEYNSIFRESYFVIILDPSAKTLPKDLVGSLDQHGNLIFLSSEYTPSFSVRKTKAYEVNQHVASGIRFVYVKKR